MTEDERVIDDGREKVNGLHDRQVIAQSIHSGVVGFVKTDQDVVVFGLWW